jgi:hypothetical protein
VNTVLLASLSTTALLFVVRDLRRARRDAPREIMASSTDEEMVFGRRIDV